MTKFLAKLNTPVALIVVVVFFVAVNGFLFYAYQQPSLPNISNAQPAAERHTADDEYSAEPSPPEQEAAAEEEAAPEEGATTGEEANPGEAAGAEDVAVPPQEEAAGTLRTGVNVVGAPTWLSVWADGESVLEGVSELGFSRQFEADREITISTGDAGAVLVEVNGYNLGALGASGEAATRTFTVGD